MPDKIDVISVGDIVTDAFIRLLPEHTHTYQNEEGKWLSVPFGTKIPYDHVEVIEAVGNASNAAVNFAGLGLNSSFVTNVGGDHLGRDMIHALDKSGVDTRFVRINPGKISNYHYVLWFQAERTILIRHENYDYHWPHLRPDEVPVWLYFSSVSEHGLEFHDQLAAWLEANSHVQLAFQPGTFQMDAGVERLKRVYRQTNVLILNREEAAFVSGGDVDDLHGLLDKLHALGPGIVVITDGPKGAYASDGSRRLKMPIYPDPQPPIDRTGAGDAFASTFVAALIKGHDIESALQWGPINSMSVCQKVGAQAGLLSEKELEHYLREAPEGYKAEAF